jgi:hypothetical protein
VRPPFHAVGSSHTAPETVGDQSRRDRPAVSHERHAGTYSNVLRSTNTNTRNKPVNQFRRTETLFRTETLLIV